MIRTAGRGPARLKTVDGLGRTLGDERFHPPEFDHRLFFNKDSKNPLRSSWITSKAHRIIARVSFLCSCVSSCLSCPSCLSMFFDLHRCTGYTGLFLAERRPVIQGNLTSATDHRAGQLLVQRLPVLLILPILSIDVLLVFLRVPSWSFVPLRGYLFCLCGLRATLSYHWSEMRVSCGKRASASL